MCEWGNVTTVEGGAMVPMCQMNVQFLEHPLIRIGEIGILRGLISKLSPVWIGLGDRGHTGWRWAEMTLE